MLQTFFISLLVMIVSFKLGYFLERRRLDLQTYEIILVSGCIQWLIFPIGLRSGPALKLLLMTLVISWSLTSVGEFRFLASRVGIESSSDSLARIFALFLNLSLIIWGASLLVKG